MPDFAKLFGSIGQGFSKDGKVRLVVLLGVVGMALVLLSHFASRPEEKEAVQTDVPVVQNSTEQYIVRMEEKLTDLITGIEGVGKARVMVTLENGMETIYVQEEKRNVDTSRETGATEGEQRVTHRENIEQSYLLVDSENGRKQALVKTQLQPKIQGVVIVCEGGDNPLVQQSLTQVVTTALHISSARVCVVKITSE